VAHERGIHAVTRELALRFFVMATPRKVCAILCAFGLTSTVAGLAESAMGEGQGPTATRPSEAGNDSAGLDDCMRSCRRGCDALSEVLRLLDASQNSGDCVKAKENLAQARLRLLEMREQMSACMLRLDHLRGAAKRVHQPAGWTCPMHGQVQQDAPGNCPICDTTLQAGRIQSPATQPALAWRGPSKSASDVMPQP
jgi:rubrerythrin